MTAELVEIMSTGGALNDVQYSQQTFHFAFIGTDDDDNSNNNNNICPYRSTHVVYMWAERNGTSIYLTMLPYEYT